MPWAPEMVSKWIEVRRSPVTICFLDWNSDVYRLGWSGNQKFLIAESECRGRISNSRFAPLRKLMWRTTRSPTATRPCTSFGLVLNFLLSWSEILNIPLTLRTYAIQNKHDVSRNVKQDADELFCCRNLLSRFAWIIAHFFVAALCSFLETEKILKHMKVRESI